MDKRIQIVTLLAAVLLVILVIELVRRRRLSERYSLLWLFSAFAILGLSIWQGLLEKLSKLIGVAYPPTALFLVAVVFILLLLLNFSTVLSRLQDETRILAQRLAILEAEQAEPEALVGAADEAQQPVSQHDQLADD
jgi:hypothetical protein